LPPASIAALVRAHRARDFRHGYSSLTISSVFSVRQDQDRPLPSCRTFRNSTAVRDISGGGQHRGSLNMTTVAEASKPPARRKCCARWAAPRCQGFLFSAAKPGSRGQKTVSARILSPCGGLIQAQPPPALSQRLAASIFREAFTPRTVALPFSLFPSPLEHPLILSGARDCIGGLGGLWRDLPPSSCHPPIILSCPGRGGVHIAVTPCCRSARGRCARRYHRRERSRTRPLGVDRQSSLSGSGWLGLAALGHLITGSFSR